jgi:hypothetical protein
MNYKDEMIYKNISNLLEIKKGDFIRGINYTHSQKYIDKPGYEQYNSTREGRVISDNHKNFFDIIIMTSEGEEERAVYDCGISGGWSLEKKYLVRDTSPTVKSKRLNKKSK